MTLAFFKLHVAGDDYVLIDRNRPGHEELKDKPELLGPLALAMLNRGRGVGGNGLLCACSDGSAVLSLRCYGPDGAEKPLPDDAALCAARWAFDSGKSAGGKVRLTGPLGGERVLRALDSRSFSLELGEPAGFLEDTPAPLSIDDGKNARIELLVDGSACAAYLIELDGRWAVALGGRRGVRSARLKAALLAAAPDAVPVVAKPNGRDVLRFVAPAGVDRLGAAAAAVCAALLAGRAEGETVAEWCGPGAAVSFADFGKGIETAADSGPRGLIDRGRFYVDWKKDGKVLAAGIAEYAFDGNFDFYPL